MALDRFHDRHGGQLGAGRKQPDGLAGNPVDARIEATLSYAKSDILRTTNEDLKHPLIQKPFRIEDMSRQIRDMLSDGKR